MWLSVFFRKFGFFLFFSLLLFSGCVGDDGDGNASKDGRIAVTTTTGMIADAVRNVGGEFVNVTSLMGPGVDPHLYKASSGDIRKLEDADIVFYNGIYLEGKMVEIFESLAKKKTTVAISDSVDASKFLFPQITPGTKAPTGVYDPHIWFDTGIWMDVVSGIAKTLSSYDPKHADFYLSNAQKYNTQLADLQVWALNKISEIPQEFRLLITSHDAFQYFGRTFGLEVMGIQGISTDSDYGLKDLERIINIIVDRRVKALFVESSVSPKSIEAVLEGVLAKDFDVKIGGQLFGDAMGDPETDEGTYLGMMRHNVSVISESLKEPLK